MAGTLYEVVLEMVSKLDVYAAALSAAKASAGVVVGFLLKKLGGVFVNKDSCMIVKCVRTEYKYGLCMQCYSKAKSRVERGDTDWDKLVQMGLCKMTADPFDDAYTKALEDN